MRKKIVVAIAGNPNAGKTTIFNGLTGARQHVGNYPGVTVEIKEGSCRHAGREIKVVDLPGTYSLTACSAEELVARDFIIKTKPDVVVDVVDSSNLERNLYLSVQFIELGIPLILVFNMSDEAKARGYEFDTVQLSRYFKARIVQTIGHKKIGMKELLDAVVQTASEKESGAQSLEKASEKQDSDLCEIRNHPFIDYGRELEEEIKVLSSMIKDIPASSGYDDRWAAVKLLENDRELRRIFAGPAISCQLEKSIAKVEALLGERPEIAIASRRYGFISGACHECVRSTVEIRHTISDKIDSVVINNFFGLPIFLGLMYLVFQLTFTVGEIPMGRLEVLFAWLGQTVGSFWPEGSESLLKSLLVDGIISGVGGVLVFLPNILFLFLAIAAFEDSGYMARAAFIMDRLMHKIGLHGKSFIPMLIGFGCSVPAIMATRTLENRRDRLTTMLVIPLVSCGARFPIYALIIPAFFPEKARAPALWTIYVIGIILAVIGAKVLRRTILKGENMPLVMELPPYRVPTFYNAMIHMWERCWLYLKKAGTIILGISVILWALSVFPGLPEKTKAGFKERRMAFEKSVMSEDEKGAVIARIDNEEKALKIETSFAGRIGHAIEPLISPMGFDWKIGTALIGAFAAKEVFVAQMGIVYAVGDADGGSESLREKLRERYNPLTAFCIMLFCLISAPCAATIAVTWRESGSLKWALFQLGSLTVLAYLLTTIVYQAGLFLKIGVSVF
jgi:ferrous iron transport protein B